MERVKSVEAEFLNVPSVVRMSIERMPEIRGPALRVTVSIFGYIKPCRHAAAAEYVSTGELIRAPCHHTASISCPHNPTSQIVQNLYRPLPAHQLRLSRLLLASPTLC